MNKPGNGSRKADTVDELLEGFGPSRVDLPRVARSPDTTPVPAPPEPKELSSTEPGSRQRQRNVILATLLSFVVVVVVGLALVKALGR